MLGGRVRTILWTYLAFKLIIPRGQDESKPAEFEGDGRPAVAGAHAHLVYQILRRSLRSGEAHDGGRRHAAAGARKRDMQAG